MKLIGTEVKMFKNFLDSSSVAIQKDVTCIVGKNESGKTAFLQALYRLNPSYGDKFSINEHYPAWLEKKHKKEGKNLSEVRPIEATFLLEESDIKIIEARFGKDALCSDQIVVSRTYDDKFNFDFKHNEQKSVAFLLKDVVVPEPFREEATSIRTIDEIIAFVEKLHADGGEQSKAAVISINTKKSALLKDKKTFMDALLDALSDLTPEFFYFHEYSELEGTIKIKEILAKKQENMNESERTARALLDLAGAEKDYLLNADYELRKRELENVANAITHDVLKYWSTNPELRVLIDVTQKNTSTNQGQQAVLDELKIRLWDDRHLLSLPFDNRSTGFRWFFSFLAAFSAFENGRPVIILLDEPGLGLHARAQKDFLRFIDERLASKCQVIYSTHSPFMVQPDHLERARLVEDKGRDAGSKVTSDILSTDKDTLFPLQGALGYDLAQHLFIAPHNLVVEGTSDYTYLSLISDYLRFLKREGLDDAWSLIPVGGADLIPSFVALLGIHLNVTVLIDSRKEGNQRLTNLVEQGILMQNRIITIGRITKTKLADIEDLFEIDEYLELYNTAFSAKIKAGDLRGADPIVNRIARHINVDRFDHGKPADVLLRSHNEFLPKLSAATLDRFESLFKVINETLIKDEKRYGERAISAA